MRARMPLWAPALLSLVLPAGCTRPFYLKWADRDTYAIINQRIMFPPFDIGRRQVDPAPSSRLADPNNPVRPPKPPDDLAAAKFMARPGGYKGGRRWDKYGTINYIEPPGWERALQLDESGTLKLDQTKAVEVGLLNSREYQTALEGVYLQALALTLNRWDFALHWYGTNNTTYTHFGDDGFPSETNTLNVQSHLGFTRNLLAGGQFIADFGNSLVFEFTGGSTVVMSNMVFTLMQPLLRNFSRRVRLEALTEAERNVLYAVRDFAHFRKQLWANIAIENGGYLDLLLAMQTLRNAQANLRRQEEAYRLYEALFPRKATALEVGQIYTSYQGARQQVVDAQTALGQAQDNFKLVLGLPPRLPIELDDSFLRDFVLTDPALDQLRDRVEAFQRERLKELGSPPTVAQLRQQFLVLRQYADGLPAALKQTKADVERFRLQLEQPPRPGADPEQQPRAQAAFDKLSKQLPEINADLAKLMAVLDGHRASVSDDTRQTDWQKLNSDIKSVLGLVDTVLTVQTEARIYMIELPEVRLEQDDALAFAKDNRLDLQNLLGLATDAWRQMWVAANALRSDLNVFATANIGTDPNNNKPFNFAASGTTYTAGVQFQAPLNRLAERNTYRASLITYQRAKRAYVALSDQIERDVRQDLRRLNQLRVGFEISRQQLLASARVVESARQYLFAPAVLRSANDTTTLNLLNGLSNLLAARNALAANYINFEQQRIQLLLDLEALQLDQRGFPTHESTRTTNVPPFGGGPVAGLGPHSAPPPPQSSHPRPVPPPERQARRHRLYTALNFGRALGGPRVFAAVSLVAALGWFGYNWGLRGHKAPDVLTAPAAKGDLVITVADRGELESSESVQAVCEVEGGGKLVTIVPEGTRVKKGDEVARLDSDTLLKGINEQEVKWEQAVGKTKACRSELEVQKNKAESEIAKAELALVLAKIDYESYEEGEYLVELDKRKGTLELGKKKLKEAEEGLDFTRSMVKKGFAQMEAMRAMELGVEGERYAVRQQEADLTVLTKFVKIRKLTELKAKAIDAKRELERTKKSQAAATEKAASELRAAEKTSALEERHLERLRRQLSKCVVRAPQDGIVIYFNRRFWDDSARIRPGVTLDFQQPFFTLPDLSRMKVNLKIHESVVKTVHADQAATMKIDALPNRVLHGRVLSVGTLAQSDDWRGAGVKEYKTGVSIDDLPADAGLRPGMTAEVTILIKTVANALMVPVQAVTESGSKHVCYVLTASGIERREVEIGENNQLYVQVLEGLEEGERVALDARSRVAAELKAAPQPARDSAKEENPTPRKS